MSGGKQTRENIVLNRVFLGFTKDPDRVSLRKGGWKTSEGEVSNSWR